MCNKATDPSSDASGTIDFDEFKAVLSANTAASGIREWMQMFWTHREIDKVIQPSISIAPG